MSPNCLQGCIADLIDVGRSAVERGLAVASGGNLSARLPEGDRYVITRSGAWLDKLTDRDFTVRSIGGDVVAADPYPSSEWKLHDRTYQVRSDVGSIVHVHPQCTVLVDALGYDVRLLTLDHAYYVRSIGTAEYHPNGSDALADAAAEQAATHDCVILRHHGCSAMGDTIEMAHRRALNLEEAAVATYRALMLGDIHTQFPADQFERLHHPE